MFIPEKIIELENKKKESDSKFTVSKLLKFIPLTAPAYTDIKNGVSIPKVNTLEKIAIFYGVDMNYFFSNMQTHDISYQEPARSEPGIDILLDRIEKQAVKINNLEDELLQIRNDKSSSSLQDVSINKSEEKRPKLKKTEQV